MGFDPLLEYSRGLQGCRKDPRADEEFADSVLRAGGNPDGDAVAHQWEFAGLGAGKLTATWMHVVEQFPGCWPGAPQEVGDCFVAGTMVTMGDGTLKPIEDVKTGEWVLSPYGSRRLVLSTFSKQYSGSLVTLSTRDSHVTCTPDHKMMSPVRVDGDFLWVKAEEVMHTGGVLYEPGTSPTPATAVGAPVCEATASGHVSTTVYCIEVDEDHAFIANGFGVHNCVSHGCKNACLTSFGCELAEGKPDEVTGKVEGKPDIPQAGIADGVLSTEAIYWWRYPQMRGMDGWVCSSAAKEVTTNAGLWLRKPYPDFDFDLTKYSASNIRKFYGRRPPDNVRDYGRQYLIRTATNVKGREQVRDFLAAGYGVFFCSGLGWSNTRNEDGVSYVRGGWAHSQAWIGYDDRPETIRKYREPLVCVLNSWGRWNRGPRKVMGTNLEIPEGAYWTPASTIDRCSGISLSSVAGWPPRKLQSYGAEGNI